MGLDMWLKKMPRYKGTTMGEVSAIECYFDLEEKKKGDPEYAKYTLKEWCGIDESELPSKEVIEYYRPFYKTRYSDWDAEHKYGYANIREEIGYWRKANQIHNWFVENVQDGEDDCCYHKECTKEILEKLYNTCKTVLESCTLVDGKVNNGKEYTKENGWRELYEDGQIVLDTSVAEELLPTSAGFFFGSYDYDEYYVDDLLNTMKIIDKALKETNFENEAIYYGSSW